jgi:hypothetical protein
MRKMIFGIVLLCASVPTYSQCACCAGAGIGSSNGEYNNGLLTLSKRKAVVELYADYRTIKDGSAPEEDEKLLTSMLINSVGVRYGIAENFTVSALLPYVSLNTASGSDSGLGDLILLGTYTFYEKNDFNFALQGGIELPTGVQKSSAFDNTTVIVGSGSYDPMAGFLFSKRWNDYTLSGNLLYKHTTPGFQQNYYGSLSVQNLSLSYRIKGASSICATDANTSGVATKSVANFGWSVFAGYSGEWLDKLKEDGVVDDDSGHYLGLANLGTNMSYKKWAFPITFSLPVLSQMNGLQNEFGVRFRIGIIRAI